MDGNIDDDESVAPPNDLDLDLDDLDNDVFGKDDDIVAVVAEYAPGDDVVVGIGDDRRPMIEIQRNTKVLFRTSFLSYYYNACLLLPSIVEVSHDDDHRQSDVVVRCDYYPVFSTSFVRSWFLLLLLLLLALSKQQL